MLGLPQIPWNRRYLHVVEEQKEREKKASAEKRGKKVPLPATCPLEDYVGEYEHPAYGHLAVSLENGKLRLDHNGFPFRRMAPVEEDTFRISLATGYEKRASFGADGRGVVTSVGVNFSPGVPDIVFRRVNP